MRFLWSTASAEYDVIARQVYYQAERQLHYLIRNKGLSAALEQNQGFRHLPPAVIIDVDDTILSNGELHYRLLAKGEPFNGEVWKGWVNESRAVAISGSKEYVKAVSAQGIKVFYVSNRNNALREGTIRNLRQLGFPISEGGKELLMLRQQDDWGWDKTTRRAYVAQNYRVIQVIGDGLGDFMGGTSSMNLAEQREASAKHMSYWGERWFMLPNPVYGDWEAAIEKGGNMKLPRQKDSIRAKYRFIRGG